MNKKLFYALMSAVAAMALPAADVPGYSFEPYDYYSEVRSSSDDGYTVTRTRVVEREISDSEMESGQLDRNMDSDDTSSYADQSAPDTPSVIDNNYPAQPASPLDQNAQFDDTQDTSDYSYVPSQPTVYSYNYSPYYVSSYPYYYPSFSLGLGWGYWNGWGPYYRPYYYRPYHHYPYWNGHHRVYGNYPHRYYGNYGHGGRGGNWNHGPRYYQAGIGGRPSRGGAAFHNSQPSGGRSFNASPRYQSGRSASPQGFGGRSGGFSRGGGGRHR